MNKLLFIIFSLLIIGNAHADNGQVSPVAGLDQKNTSVVNNNFQNVQTGINGIFGLFAGYFTGGYLNTSSGGTGTSSVNWAANSIPYMSAKGTWSNIGIGTTGQVLTVAGSPAWSSIPTQISNYNTTAPLITIYEDDSDSGGIGDASTIPFRSSIFSRAGTVNVSLTAKALNGAATGTAYIRKNGVQVGTTRNLTAVYQTWAEDISVAIGDYLDIKFGVCSNNCEALTFIISAGNAYPESAIKTDNSARLSPIWKFGNGSPQTNAIDCNKGDLYSRLDCTTTITCLYVCTTAGGTWTAK